MLKATRDKQRAAVCIVRHNYYPDGHVRRDAETLAEAGYDVSVIALRRADQPARESLNGIEVYRLPVEHRRGSILRYLWEYSLFFVLAFLTLTYLHLRKGFRVVEVNNMPDVLVFTALVPKITGSRIIFYIFDNMPELLVVTRKLSPRHVSVRLLEFIERMAVRFADRVIVTQEMARRVVQARGAPAEKLTVVLNCPDETLFPIRLPDKRVRTGETFEIVTHGTIVERYGIQNLIDALPEIARVVPSVRVQVFGAGEYREELAKRARRIGVADRVCFRGLVPLDELVANLVRADVGYVGMLCDLMLSNKLMEYVALGVPAVVARWSTYEYYFPDDAVTYFRPDDPEDLAGAILAIFRDPEGARRRAERASALYRQYCWSVQRDVYLGIYADLLTRAAEHHSRHPSRSSV